MKQRYILPIAAIFAFFTSFIAQAGVTTDSHGNVGYDTAAECDAAVLSGNAKFYQSFTKKPALVRNGEKTVRIMTLRDAGYPNGACDIGVGHKAGRDGVSPALQGKYIPFSPDMLVNVYSNAAGEAVRISMKQCDNWFSDNKPRAVEFVRNEPQTHEEVNKEATTVTTPVIATVTAPVTAVAKKLGAKPYVFGTLGVLQDGVKVENGANTISDKDTRLAGQVGVGMQFNHRVGGKVFYARCTKTQIFS
ncbi:hypothetical protein MIS46_03210 [Wielerella bovis]|uniref:hypothetical protein n=1 Tax=Wielerella bovis TaxID=2917790 RepID=UPI00201949C4|nr:hypothetical protein [Wielerella bovis]ULJ63077.1 hypothetical protein MIS46_03210 [Wielerella bovis]